MDTTSGAQSRDKVRKMRKTPCNGSVSSAETKNSAGARQARLHCTVCNSPKTAATAVAMPWPCTSWHGFLQPVQAINRSDVAQSTSRRRSAQRKARGQPAGRRQRVAVRCICGGDARDARDTRTTRPYLVRVDAATRRDSGAGGVTTATAGAHSSLWERVRLPRPHARGLLDWDERRGRGGASLTHCW